MLLLSLLVIITLGVRLGFQMLPAREPSGMDEFQEDAIAILAAMEEADSLKRAFASEGSHAGFHLKPAAFHSSQKWQKSREILPINLNEADSAALLPLPGIGPVFAGRIIKYRRLLGGYVSPEQLMEVYGMEGETLRRIGPSIYIDSTMVEKLDINSAGFRTLLRHPYLEYNDVKALLNYRDLQGHIGSEGEIWEHGLLSDSTLERIAPYLIFSL